MTQIARQEQSAVSLVGLAALILGVIILVVRLRGDNGGPDDEPPNDGPNGGGPTDSLNLLEVRAPQFIASGSREVRVVGPGQTLRVNASQVVAFQNLVTVKNTGTHARYLTPRMVFTDKTITPDLVWLRFDPGRGLTANFPMSNGIVTTSTPVLDGFRVAPDQTREVFVGCTIEGPGISQEHSSFWVDYDVHAFQLRVELYEVSFTSAQGGTRLFERTYSPITLDLVVLA